MLGEAILKLYMKEGDLGSSSFTYLYDKMQFEVYVLKTY
jgi:hypothetical protein